MPTVLHAAALVLFCTAALASAFACDDTDRIADVRERFFILAEGDSITFGTGSNESNVSYVRHACVPQSSGIETIVQAVPGATLGSATSVPGMNSLYGRMLQDNAILAGKKGGRIAILSILIGRNDLFHYRGGPDAYAEDLVRYIRTMRRAGWDRVIVGTLLPSTWPGFNAARNRLNAILTKPGWASAHGIDAIADFAALPDIGPTAAAARTDIFVDGTHPTSKGYKAMAPAWDRALKAVMLQR